MSTRTKILIVEHDTSDLELMHYELKKGGIIYTSEVVQNEQEYAIALQGFNPDIILSDFSLPSFDGPTAFKMREREAPNTPFIFVSGHIGEENSIEYIQNGVTDYVLKDKLFTLVTKVRRALKESKEKREKVFTEQVLIESGKRLARAQQLAHMGSWELNFSSRLVQCSDEVCRIFGLSSEENVQTFEEWQSYIHPADLDYVLAANAESVENFTSTSLNHRIILKNRAIKHIYSESRFEFDQSKTPVGLYGIVYDISERKIAEENLLKSESGLKEAQAIASVGSWEVDLSNDAHVWSDEVYKIFGVSKDEVSPSREAFMAFFHPEDLNYAKERIAEGVETFQNITFDFRFIRKDGIVRYGYNEWKFKFDKKHEPERLFGIIQDITERKLAEIERIKMFNDLMLRNRELEQFAYIVSHNLRAPVANIIGATNTLNDPELSAERKEILGRGINESVTKLDSVIKDLNHILQVKHTINETKEIVRFSKLVDDIKFSIKNLVDKCNIEIRYDFSEIDEFLTLKSYLYSIFYNLISNSIKYCQQDVLSTLEIKSRRLKDRLELFFTDNGMGIDLQKKDGQVFGLYKRFHLNIEGKGMGLFMVKTQVETLGGKISINSEVNKGTEFKIEFEL